MKDGIGSQRFEVRKRPQKDKANGSFFVAVPHCFSPPAPGLGATWNAAGEIVFNPTNRAPLMHISAAGGTPLQLTALDNQRQENSHRRPSFMPDGHHYLFTARSSLKENTAIYVGSLDSKETKRLLTEQSNAVYSPPGYLLFGREGTLMAQRFEPARLELSGNAFPVAGNIDHETPSSNAFFSVSADGSVIAYHEAGRAMEQLTWFNRDGSIQGIVGPKGLYGQPRLSPDGKRLAVHIPDPISGNRDIWIINLVNASKTRFTSNPANDWFSRQPDFPPSRSSSLAGDLYRRWIMCLARYRLRPEPTMSLPITTRPSQSTA